MTDSTYAITRFVNALLWNDVTIQQAQAMTDAQLLRIEGVGKKGVAWLRKLWQAPDTSVPIRAGGDVITWSNDHLLKSASLPYALCYCGEKPLHECEFPCKGFPIARFSLADDHITDSVVNP